MRVHLSGIGMRDDQISWCGGDGPLRQNGLYSRGTGKSPFEGGGAQEEEGVGLPENAGTSWGLADLPKGFGLYSKSHY